MAAGPASAKTLEHPPAPEVGAPVLDPCGRSTVRAMSSQSALAYGMSVLPRMRRIRCEEKILKTGPVVSGVAVACLFGCATPSSQPGVDASTAEAACLALPRQSTLAATRLSARYVPANARRAGGTPAGAVLPGHCIVTGSVQPRIGVDSKPYATGFELSLPGPMERSLSLPRWWRQRRRVARYVIVLVDFARHPVAPRAGVRRRIDRRGPQRHERRVRSRPSCASRPRIRLALQDCGLGQVLDCATIPADTGVFLFLRLLGWGPSGMMFSQRFPDMFDGITAGAPAMRVSSGATVAAMWNTLKLTAVAPRNNAGQPILSQAFSNGDLDAKGVNSACDAADGVVDGMVQNIRACGFDPAVLQCRAAKADDCLSAGQVAALRDTTAGPRDAGGRTLYPAQGSVSTSATF